MTTATQDSTQTRDLGSIIRGYHEVTERLKHSHELLAREVGRLRTQLEEKNRELARRERLAALGEMAAGMAHEIRNPLGGIGLYASLLLKDLSDRPEQQEIARGIQAGVATLDQIVGDILTFAGGAEPNFRKASLADVLERCLSQVAPRLLSHGVTVAELSDVSGVIVECDARLIERALSNLLFNAIDAAGEGGWVAIRVDASAAPSGSVSFVVEDSGDGVAEELLHRVFDPFFTTKDSGTGLGLAIVHRIAEQHDGHVTVANRAGGGAVFILSIPLARGASAAVPTLGVK